MPKPKSSVNGRSVRDEAEARELLAAVASGAQPLKSWCHANGVNPHSLYWWRSKLSRDRTRGRVRRRVKPREARGPEAIPVAECQGAPKVSSPTLPAHQDPASSQAPRPHPMRVNR